jgi:uridylate kinase
MNNLKYKRILLKVSGEALAGDNSLGIDAKIIQNVAKQIVALASSGVEIAIVIGGGNIFRGMAVAANGGDRVIGDHMGMLSTVINALALGDAILQNGGKSKVFSSLSIPAVADDFTQRDAIKALETGNVILCAGGTGNPFFTTDTAAALKAVELKCDVLLKGTKVDGVYDDDPIKNPKAKRFSTISYDEVLKRDLRVMDTAAFALARDNNLPIVIYALDVKEGLAGILNGKAKSTYVRK